MTYERSYVQDPPFTLKVESCEGCNLRCGFCGIRGIREKGPAGDLSGPYYFMEVETAKRIASSLRLAREESDWNPRIEMAEHGEPTLNPALPEIISLLRAAAPRTHILLLTNGIPLLEGDGFARNLDRLYEAGATTIGVDDYRPHVVAPEWEKYERPGITKWRYPDEGRGGNPHVRKDVNRRRLILVADLAITDEGTHSNIANHCGAAAPRDESFNNRRCAMPFRELLIRWNGNAGLCCDDWRGQYRIGSVHESSLVDLWHSERFYAARAKLYAADRGFGPCDGCTNVSPRVGLLPNRMGRGTPAPPSEQDELVIERVLSEPTMAPVVMRRWEK